MKFFKSKFKKGFSLIEIIIYLAIFSTFSIILISSMISSLSSFSIIHSNKILQDAGLNSMERISREIRSAISVDITNSTFDDTDGVLKLNDSGITFAKIDNYLNIYEDDGTLVGNLIGDNVYIDSLIFRYIDTTYGEAVKIEMILRDPNSQTNKKAYFYNTIILRDSY